MHNQTISLLISKEELELLKNVVYLEPYLQDNIQKARRVGRAYRITFDQEDLNEAIDAIDFSISMPTSNLEQKNMIKFLDRLQRQYHLMKE